MRQAEIEKERRMRAALQQLYSQRRRDEEDAAERPCVADKVQVNNIHAMSEDGSADGTSSQPQPQMRRTTSASPRRASPQRAAEPSHTTIPIRSPSPQPPTHKARTPSPPRIPTSPPASPPKLSEEQLSAGARIAEFYRRAKSMHAVRALNSKFDARLAYTAPNKPLHAYTEALIRLLNELDAVQSWGDRAVREERRDLARLVEGEAARVERWWKGVWKAHCERPADVEMGEADEGSTLPLQTSLPEVEVIEPVPTLQDQPPTPSATVPANPQVSSESAPSTAVDDAPMDEDPQAPRLDDPETLPIIEEPAPGVAFLPSEPLDAPSSSNDAIVPSSDDGDGFVLIDDVDHKSEGGELQLAP
ncbi:hypothetical protein BV25DRAFT_1824444 [Artomyces pyxidatus]|uniref:Uncharacterized protein n=1 Tax=Artomyces pyxidatus TaxID=48021 RepID=A0ACB8T4N2_9AGAM|nr:hypothetical protein BV25DRAFT_1824444 [Artomyces pyxidatus]